jgi:hypothetical protein
MTNHDGQTSTTAAKANGASPEAPVDEFRVLESLSGVDWVAKAAEIALRKRSAAKDDPMSGPDIYAAVKGFGVSIPVAENTFGAYLSEAVKRVETPLSSTGRGRGGGYFLSGTSEALAKEATAPPAAEPAEERGKEKWLYPSLVSWMLGQQYNAKDTSAVRSRELGKWGNPDVTGIAVHEHLTRLEIEIATIEAKVGFDSWESDFFQAVSQRRFANRAYFAFALPEEASEKLPADLRYYSELFSVGVLVVDLGDDLYDRLTGGSLTAADKKFLGDPSNSLVREVLSAPWHYVPTSHQRKFCEALNIRDVRNLMVWGREES